MIRGEVVVQVWIRPGEAAVTVTIRTGEKREEKRIPAKLKPFLQKHPILNFFDDLRMG